METRDTYQAGQSADESATPEKVIPLRQPWAQIEMDILTLGARCFSLAGTRCLLYLLRYTVGFHTMTVKLTVDEFCNGKRRKDGGRFDEGTDLSRPSVLSGLHELERAHVIAIANEGHGRGTVATYELFPVECWQVERLSIGKKSLPINDEASIGKDSSPIAASNGKSSLPKRRIIGKKSLPHINIEVKDSPEKERDTDANASGRDAIAPASDTPATPSSSESSPEKPARKPRKERELSPDHQYRVTLLAAIDEARGGKSPNHDAEWSAAGKFYRWNNGQPAAVDDVAACYTLELQRPKWDSDTPLLNVLLRTYGAYVKNRANFRAGIERARAAADGKYDAPRQNGRATVPDIPSTIPRLND